MRTLKQILSAAIYTGLLMALIYGLSQIFHSPMIAIAVFVLSIAALAWLGQSGKVLTAFRK